MIRELPRDPGNLRRSQDTATSAGYPPKPDPFADFDFGAPPAPKGGPSSGAAPVATPKTETRRREDEGVVEVELAGTLIKQK